MYKEGLIKYNKKTGKSTKDKLRTLLRAVEKIKLSVYYVYENKKISEEIKKIQEEYGIPDNFFKDYKPQVASNKLEVLLAENILVWDKNRLGITAKKSLKDLDAQIFNETNYDQFNPGYINSKLWHFIIGAKIFNIPKERLLKCNSNMLDMYFPKIDINLQLQTYPSTTIDEIKFIWSDIEERQNVIKQKEGKKGKFEYPNYERDKMAYALNLEGVTHAKIAGILNKKFNKTCAYADIPKVIDKYKKFIEEFW